MQGEEVPATQKDPEGWWPADKFTVVLETAGLNATELGAYSREWGLFPEQVDRWRQAAQGCQRTAAAVDGRAEGPREAPPAGSTLDQAAPAGIAPQGEGPGGGGGTADRLIMIQAYLGE